MNRTLSRLLRGIIDYAGLYPPATLSPEDTVRNYFRYLEGEQKWLITRLVWPAATLDTLTPLLEKADPAEPVCLSIVSSGGKTREEWQTNLEADVKSMNGFQDAVGDLAEIEAIEIRVPSHEGLDQYLADLNGFSEIDTYIELPWAEDMPDSLATIAATEWMGAKGRTGGMEPTAFPSAESLAIFLQNCCQLDLPFKLTAGLHQPFRHTDKDINVKAHGFLNILTGLTLCDAHDLNKKEMVAILEDEDPASFKFTDDHVHWRGLSADLEYAECARDLFVAYGSCSVEEPLQCLRDLGLLQGVPV